MASEPTAREYIIHTGQKVSEYLASLFSDTTTPDKLFQAMNYSLLGAGKRLRPVLCIATAETFGVDSSAVMPAAAALELIHSYSLVHDDLPSMDNDDLRRGRPTNHKVFGDATALLAGDALLTYAFELLSKPLSIPAEKQLRVIHTLAHAAGAYGMVGGQQADVLAEQTEGSLEALQFIHINKTGKLIQAAVIMGGLFADLTESESEALSTYGLSLGLAFQMIDDWLDVAGDENVIGKPVGSDERLQKLTYPRLLGLDETKALAERTLEEGISTLEQANIAAPTLVGIANYITNRSK